jgi:uncharacterized phage protein (TIGR02218 family)
VFAYTSAADSVTIDGTTYDATQGLTISSLVNTEGLAVDNLELTTLDDGTVFTKTEVFGGIWKGASFVISRYITTHPEYGVEYLLAGTLGEVRLTTGRVTIELRGLQQYLQQPVGSVTSATCRARLGDSHCTVALGPLTKTGSLTTVTDRYTFRDSTRTEADDYFGEGIITFTSGACLGMSAKIRSYTSATKEFVLTLGMITDLQVGDTYTAIAGCRKRFQEDCITRYSNGINFQGEPHMPGIDQITAAGV